MPNERLRLHLAGQLIGNYRLVRRISAGGMAEVYLAEEAADGQGTGTSEQSTHTAHPHDRPVAVKVVCPTDEITLESGITDIEGRFMREGALLQRLHHPGILPVYASGADRDYLYHVMEYVPNGSLADAICGRAERTLTLPVPLPLGIDIIRQVGDALEYVHQHGIVHRDVKPGNLLVRLDREDGWHLLLADFGVACAGADTIRREDQVTGTVAYMAPEVFSGWFSPASDQYSLAVMAFQLLTSHLPFEGTFDEQIAGHLQVIAPSVRMYVEDVPWEIEEVIARALEKREVDRFPSVAAFVEELDTAYHEALFGEEDTAPLAVLAAVHTAGHSTIPVHPGRTEGPHYPVRTLVTLLTALLLFLAMLIILAEVPSGFGGWSLRGAGGGQSPGRTVPGKSHQRTPATISVTPASTGPIPTATPPVPAVALTDSAHLVALSAPSSVTTGSLFSFQVTLANTGTSTWVGGKGYRLTCDWLRHPAQNCPQGFAATLGNYAVAPGSQVTFQVWLTALTSPGVYTAWINMAHSSSPFGTQDIFVSVQTVASTPTTSPLPTTTPLPPPTSTPVPTASPLPTTTPLPQPPAPMPAVSPSPSSSVGTGGDSEMHAAWILSQDGLIDRYASPSESSRVF